MKRTICAALVAGLAFSTFAARASAQDADPGAEAHEGHEMSAAKLKDKLGLSDDQVTKLDAAWKSAKDAAKPYQDQMKADMAKLKQQVESKASDDDIKATLDDLDAAHKGMQGAMEKAKADSRSILTPTQQAKMALRMHHRMEKMRKKWHEGKEEEGKKEPAAPAPAPQPAQ